VLCLALGGLCSWWILGVSAVALLLPSIVVPSGATEAVTTISPAAASSVLSVAALSLLLVGGTAISAPVASSCTSLGAHECVSEGLFIRHSLLFPIRSVVPPFLSLESFARYFIEEGRLLVVEVHIGIFTFAFALSLGRCLFLFFFYILPLKIDLIQVAGNLVNLLFELLVGLLEVEVALHLLLFLIVPVV